MPWRLLIIQFTILGFISACGTHKNGEGRPGLKYHVRIVGGAIGKALLLFPLARSPSHLVEELLASRIICTRVESSAVKGGSDLKLCTHKANR